MKMVNRLHRSRIRSWFLPPKETMPVTKKDEYEQLCDEIEAARKEWAIAQQHIDYVSDPELIDHAIYHLEAAERKYGFLLRQAKKKYREKSKQIAIEPSL